MDIKALQYFIAVVEATSISAAARQLHISQPPLSRQIKMLEQELGVRLLERGSRHITLTDAGETLYHRAKTIVDFTNNSLCEIQDIGKGNEGHLRLGMISSCGPVLLPGIISAFARRFPRVLFDIYERNTYELLESLENNLIELAFVRTPFDTVDVYNRIVLSREPLLAVGGRKLLEDSPAKLPPASLQGRPVIIYRRWKYILEKFFETNGIEPIYYCVSDDARTALMWAVAGHGIAIIPDSISHMLKSDDMRYVPLDAPGLTSSVCAIWMTRRHISPALQNFIDVLEEFRVE